MVLVALLAGMFAQSPPPPPAGLKATIRISLVKLQAPAVHEAEKTPPFGNFGPLLTQLLTPEGPVDIQYTIVGGDTRADIQGRLATLPKGTFVLQRVGDETIRVVDPA